MSTNRPVYEKSSLYNNIATHLHDVDQILQEISAEKHSRPDLETAFAEPRIPMEKQLADIWAEILKLDHVGIYDNFFDLGGDSLLAAQTLSRMQEKFGVELPIGDIIARSFTIAEAAIAFEDYLLAQATDEEIASVVQQLDGLPEEEIRRLLFQDSR